CRLPKLRLLVVGLGDFFEQLDRVALRGPVLQTDDRDPANGDVRIMRGELGETRAESVDIAGVGARERFERDERRASGGRALVLEAAAQKLELLPEPKLADRAVGLRSNAVVAVPCVRFQLVVPLRAQTRERPLVPRLRQGLRLGRGLRQAGQCVASERGAGPTYRADGRNRRPVRFCSRMWA